MKTRACLALIFLFAMSAAHAKPKHPAKPKPAPAPEPNVPKLSPTPEPEPIPAPAPAPEPKAEPKPEPKPEPPPEKPKVDLESLNAEYHAIRDELFKSRAKAELVGNALYKTRLVATFQYKAQRAWPLKKVTLRIDDQPVYSADAPNAEEPIKIYEGFAAPGKHAVAVRVECGAQGDSRLSYSTEDTFVFDAADDKQARVELTVDEVGDGPQPLAKKKAGDFDVRVRARVKSLEKDAK